MNMKEGLPVLIHHSAFITHHFFSILSILSIPVNNCRAIDDTDREPVELKSFGPRLYHLSRFR